MPSLTTTWSRRAVLGIVAIAAATSAVLPSQPAAAPATRREERSDRVPPVPRPEPDEGRDLHRCGPTGAANASSRGRRRRSANDFDVAPGGGLIAFQCCGATCGIYMVHPDGSGLRRVDRGCTGGRIPPACTASNSYPAISPDGVRRSRSSARSGRSSTTRPPTTASIGCASTAADCGASRSRRHQPPRTSNRSGRRRSPDRVRPPQRHGGPAQQAGRVRRQRRRHRRPPRHAVRDQGRRRARLVARRHARSCSAARRPRTSPTATSGRSSRTAAACARSPTPEPQTKVYSASFSPDGSAITLGMTGVDGQADVWRIGIDGSGLAPVTQTPRWDSAVPTGRDPRAAERPVPSRASRTEPRRASRGPTMSHALPTAGGRARRARRLALAAALAALAIAVVVPGHSRAAFPGANGTIAFERFASGREDGRSAQLFTRAPDGTVRQLTHLAGGASGSAWSPDGSLVAFERRHDRTHAPDELFAMNADGSGAHALTTGCTRAAKCIGDDLPAFSPDGRSIVFEAHHAHRPAQSAHDRPLPTAGQTIEQASAGDLMVVDQAAAPRPALQTALDPQPCGRSTEFSARRPEHRARARDGDSSEPAQRHRDGPARPRCQRRQPAADHAVGTRAPQPRLVARRHADRVHVRGRAHAVHLHRRRARAGLTQLTKNEAASTSSGCRRSWSPDGTQIAFSRSTPGDHAAVPAADGPRRDERRRHRRARRDVRPCARPDAGLGAGALRRLVGSERAGAPPARLSLTGRGQRP